MSTRLHVIVSCANRKSHPPFLRLSHFPDGTVESRAKSWWRSLCDILSINSRDFVCAQDLYKGNYWFLVQQLIKLAKKQGFEPNLWILSAGFGLVTGTDRVVSYSATFTRGDEDSVVGKTYEPAGREVWWTQLTKLPLPDSDNPRSLKELIRAHPGDHFLMVASSEYLNAVQSDLISGISLLNKTDNLILISSKTNQIAEELKPFYISTDARLLCSPNCADNCNIHPLGRNVRGSIGISMAAMLMERTDTKKGFSADEFRRVVGDVIVKSPHLFTHKRIPLSDLEVKSYIRHELRGNRSLSATHLLRKFRVSGMACEQKRFRHLYLEVKEKRK